MAAMTALFTGCGGQSATTETAQNADNTVQEAETTESAEEASVHEHTWAEATCTQPRTCTECGETEGEPLEHEWTPATLEAPKTCVNCGATEGEAVTCKQFEMEKLIGSGWDRWVTYSDSIICGKRLSDHSIEVGFYDYDGNLLNSFTRDFGYNSWGYSILSNFDPDSNVIAVQVAETEGSSDTRINLYDPKGNMIKEFEIDYDLDKNNDTYISLTTCTDHRYVAINAKPSLEVIKYIDTQTMELMDTDQVDTVLIRDDEVAPDESRFKKCYKQHCGNASGYLVESADESKWGYADEDFNEIAMYVDASDFNIFGYALVSEDGTNYDIIDKDFNVVAKDYIQGDGASTDSYGGGGATFVVRNGDSRINLYIKGDAYTYSE